MTKNSHPTGILAPAGTPGEIIKRWQAEIAKPAHSKNVSDKFHEQGFEVTVSTPEEFGRYLRAEHAKWAELIRTAKIPLQ